jgi:hypothetical protein
VIPTATSNMGHMEVFTEKKLCRKGLHWYPITDRRCRECHKVTRSKWYQVNRELLAEKQRKWSRSNPELKRECSRRWRRANPELARKHYKKWEQANLDTVNAISSRKRAAKKNALTLWTDANAIKNFYTEARKLTELTGVKHHVDHIYPLQSEYMCGLHVETNLQILTEKENIIKGNRTWPGQLECQKGSVYARFPKELTDLLND